MPALTCPQCGKPTSKGLCAGVCPECLATTMLGGWDDTGFSDEPAPEDIITRVADYDVLRVLGRGGMGIVCRARDRLLGREVALKLIHSGVLASDEQLRRFRLEAEAVASLRHPNLIVIHEAGEADGQPYFTMTLAENGTLAQRLQTKGALDPRTAARLVQQLALAVHHAHTRGVLHRDLKPANILFDAEDRALVSDFGLARFTNTDSITNSGSLLGTPAYLAPEVASGSAGHTTSSDVYALGIILFECITGRPPFDHESPLILLKQITEDDLPPPSSFVKDIDRDLEAVCLHALDREPANRYPSAEALAQDLGLWLNGESVTARHPPSTERIWRWARRNQSRAVLYSMAAVSVFILMGLTAIWNILLRSEQSTTAQAMHRSETRRAGLLRDHAVQLMGNPGTLLRALPLLDEADHLTTGDTNEDLAIRLRRRVIRRLTPFPLYKWATTTPQPVLAWSSDSRLAACTDGGVASAFDLDKLATGNPATATLTTTAPHFAMPVPDDGTIPLHSLSSPDGSSILVHSRKAVTLWTQAEHLARWRGQGLQQVWFDASNHLHLLTDKATLQLQPDGTTPPATNVSPPKPDKTEPLLTATIDPGGLIHFWRNKAGDAEAYDPLPHPGPVMISVFDPTFRYLATLSADHTLLVWEIATSLAITPPLPTSPAVTHIVWSPTRQQLAVWSDTEVVWFDW